VSPWWYWPVGVRTPPARAVVAVGSRGGRFGAVDLAAGCPRRSAAARKAAGEAQAAPRDYLTPDDRAIRLGLDHTSCHTSRRFTGNSPCDFLHFGPVAPQPARPSAATLKP